MAPYRNQNAGSLEIATRALENIRNALDRSAIVATTDRRGLITHVNDKFCEISKYSREELLGQNHRLINSGYHSKEFFVEMWKTISHGQVWEGEVKNKAKDGSFYWVYTTIVPFLDLQGNPDQYVSIRYEITGRKTAEDRLRFYADRLEKSNRELQDFASIAAHDLQEPLRKILAFGERLDNLCRPHLPEDGKNYLDRMLFSAKRMRTLIEDLLTYSRVTTQAKPFQRIDLDQVMRDVLTDLEFRIEETQGSIEVETLPVIDADSLQIRQLFQNLLSNALKFHRPGFPPRVRVSSTLEGAVCKISVKDQGIGFDEKYLDKIFTIFQRLHGKQEYEGTGVGLAVCRRIVERHGGSITAKSQIGQGAEFLMTLPIRQN